MARIPTTAAAPARGGRALVIAVMSVPAGIRGQFLAMGLALFRGPPGWGGQAALGFVLLLPSALIIAFSASARRTHLLVGVVLHVVQVVLAAAEQAAGPGVLQALSSKADFLLSAAAALRCPAVPERQARAQDRDGGDCTAHAAYVPCWLIQGP